ncbi:hypothetical protein D3C81_741370 [compost metagenome]
MLGFLLDQLEQLVLHDGWRNRQRLPLLGFRVARNEIKQLGGILADCRIGRKQSDIGVKPGGDVVVVAGAHMDITLQVATFLANDKQDLGMGF